MHEALWSVHRSQRTRSFFVTAMTVVGIALMCTGIAAPESLDTGIQTKAADSAQVFDGFTLHEDVFARPGRASRVLRYRAVGSRGIVCTRVPSHHDGIRQGPSDISLLRSRATGASAALRFSSAPFCRFVSVPRSFTRTLLHQPHVHHRPPSRAYLSDE